MIFEHKKVVFIHYPKTGGNSIQDALRQYTEDSIITEISWQDGVERFGVANPKYSSLRKHSTLGDYKRELGNRFYDYQFFITMRNPFDRLVSSYFSPSRFYVNPNLKISTDSFSMQKFDVYVRQVKTIEHFLNIEDWHSTTNICFLKFENLEDDFRKLCRALEIPYIGLPKRNASKRICYRECFNETLKQYVCLKHKYEISIGNYEF